MKMPRVLVALLAVSMLGIGASTAEAAAEKNQEVKFTTVPSGAIVGGPTRTVSAESVEAGGSHQPTNPPVDLTAEGGCSIPEGSKESATVTFTSATDCTILAKAPETSEWKPAEAKEEFGVAKGTQTLKFTSTAPTAAVVGGPAYTVTAESLNTEVPPKPSGETPELAIDPASTSACSLAGSSVTFKAGGTCTIDAKQKGGPNYNAASQVQQSFQVQQAMTVQTPPPQQVFTPTPTPKPTPPNGNFVISGVSIDTRTGGITFFASFQAPGAFRWLFTFPNGKFGVYKASAGCAADQRKLRKKCVPANITFAKGQATIPGVGRLKVWFKPSASGLRALKAALKQHKRLPVSATYAFQPTGGSTVSRNALYAVKLRRR